MTFGEKHSNVTCLIEVFMVFKNDFKSLQMACDILFDKDFFGVSFGSISQRINEESFIINKEDTILKNVNEDDFCKLVANESMRWNEASYDSYVHYAIYKTIKEAKFVIHSFSPYAAALCYQTSGINLLKMSKEGIKSDMLKVFDTGITDDERLQNQIPTYFVNTNQNIVLTRKSGVWSYGKDLSEACENLYHLEHLCKIKYIMR